MESRNHNGYLQHKFAIDGEWQYVVARLTSDQDWACVLRDDNKFAWYPVDQDGNLILIGLDDEPIYVPKHKWYSKWKVI